MLVTSIFFFFLNVFYPIKDINHHLSKIYFVVCKLFQFGFVKIVVVQQELNVGELNHTIPNFNNLEKKAFENIEGKGENADTILID